MSSPCTFNREASELSDRRLRPFRLLDKNSPARRPLPRHIVKRILAVSNVRLLASAARRRGRGPRAERRAKEAEEAKKAEMGRQGRGISGNVGHHFTVRYRAGRRSGENQPAGAASAL